MILKILIIAVAVTRPFKDPHERFSINLPRGWTTGMASASALTFTKGSKAGLANAAVQILPVELGTSTAKIAVMLTQALEDQPGFMLLDQGASKLGGRKAARRRYQIYVNGDPKLPKIAEDRVIVLGTTAYVVHVEAMTAAFATLTKDFNKLFSSFQPGRGATTPRVSGLSGAPLIGTWLMVGAEETVLILRANGTFELAGIPGVFGQDGNSIILRPNDGGPEQFNWRIEGSELVLTSEALGARTIRYRRKE